MGNTTNRFKFNKANLALIEKQVDKGEFTKETYIYDDSSHLSILVRPNRSYIECTFCIYERIRIRGQAKSRLYKRQIMKVSDARNTQLSLTTLRQKADNLFLDIVEGRDPQLIALQTALTAENEKLLAQAKQTIGLMIFGPLGKVSESQKYTVGFIAERGPSKSYLKDIEGVCRTVFADVIDTPLYAISTQQVTMVYLKQAAKGKTVACNAMRILRSVWNWAQAKYDDTGIFVRNPVGLAMRQLGVNINQTNRRKKRLQDNDFKPYVKAVLDLRYRDHSSAFRNGRDALLFMLFSGVRLTGTMTIPFVAIDIEKKLFKIIKKGGEEACLPLNSVTESIVRHRLKYLPHNVEYLFPGVTGNGHYRGSKASRKNVGDVCGVSMTNHDLRRTYKTIGAELDINHILIDELLCHIRAGVDAHYVHPSIESLRKASQKIADYIIEQSGVNVVKILESEW